MAAPQSTLTPNSKKEQDDAHNTFQQNADEKFNGTDSYKSTADELKELEDYANGDGGIDQLERFANNPANATQNRQDVKEQEEANNDINYTGSGQQEDQKKQKFTFNVKDWKKAGPMGFIALLFGGGGFLGGVIGPPLGLVQMQEAFAKDLNDQLAAVTEADAHLMKTKLKTLQAGFSLCGSKITIRCKFGTMSKPEVKKFRDAGFIIEPDNGEARTKPTSITFPPNDDGSPGRRVTNPNELNTARTNPNELRHLRAAFNPRFGTLTDKIANAVLLRLHLDRRSVIPSTNDRAAQEAAVTENSRGLAGVIDGDGTRVDDDGRKYYTDADGTKVYETGEGSNPARFRELAEQNAAFIQGLREQMADTSGSSVSKFLGAAVKGVNVVGHLDTACTIYNVARAVAAMAKFGRALQMSQVSMRKILTPGSQTKAGDMTTEIATYVGNDLNFADMNKTVRDETTIQGVDENGNMIYGEKPNPDYLKTAYDSRGYKLAAYDDPRDAGPLSSREQQFTTGGGLVGTLESVMSTITSTLGLGNDAAGRAAIKEICSVVQSWWARTIGLVVGLISAAGSFGTSTAISIGSSVALQLALGFAMPFLKAALSDGLAGKVAGGWTKGINLGDVGFSGAGKILGDTAMGRGARPANVSTQKSYKLIGKEIEKEYIAVDTLEAQKTPLDIMNQYSFLGSFARTINPVLLKSTASFSGALVSIPTIIGTAFNGLVPFSHAAEVFNAERYQQCKGDMGYEELGIDADNFCNVRYIFTDKQMAMIRSPDGADASAVWMENNGHIDDEGNAKSDEYNRWIKSCTQREDGWGETSNDEPEDYDAETGKICMEDTIENDYFAVFTLFKGMEEARETTASESSSQSAFWSETSLGSEGAGL